MPKRGELMPEHALSQGDILLLSQGRPGTRAAQQPPPPPPPLSRPKQPPPHTDAQLSEENRS